MVKEAMNRLVITIFFLAFTCSLHAQPYLITNAAWQQKIKANYFLAPLFYGVKKDNAQVKRETSLQQQLITQYGSSHSAYRELLITGWNYFTLGMTDSAIFNFNQAWLLDTTNLETFLAFGSIITFLDGQPNFQLITQYKLNEKVPSGWDVTAFFGDPAFLDELRTIRKTRTYTPNLSRLLANPRSPYFVDSSKYVLLKIRSGDEEGFYKMGRRSGPWTDYYTGTNKVMRRYTIVNGVESGQISAYHRNGKRSSIFSKNALGEIDGEFQVYDYNGDLVRIEHWHKNSMNPKDSKIIKDWEEDGKITTEVVNGQLKQFIWKGGRKTPVK